MKLVNIKGEELGKVTLNDNLWGIEPNDAVLYDALVLAQNSMRQGTASTKTRDEVSGGGRKPWRQKGTGRARQGSTRAPHWYHGGVVFGPHPRSFSKKMNRKERRLALKSALAYKNIESSLIVVDSFVLETNKTKEMIDVLKNMNITGKVLIVVSELEDNLILASRNLSNVILLRADEINVLDIVGADKMIVTKEALKSIEEALV